MYVNHIEEVEREPIPSHKLTYSIRRYVLTATLRLPDGRELRDTYDFRGLKPEDGRVRPEPQNLPFPVVLGAWKDKDGELHLALVLWREEGESLESAIYRAWPAIGGEA